MAAQENTEAYRSGHNEAVLKTVWVQAHGGSNPSASASKNLNRTPGLGSFLMLFRFSILAYNAVKSSVSAYSRLYRIQSIAQQADGLCRESRLT